MYDDTNKSKPKEPSGNVQVEPPLECSYRIRLFKNVFVVIKLPFFKMIIYNAQLHQL